MKKNFAIAIDGPAAAGKSTIAKIVAQRLNITYIDTGAMYRAFTWYTLEKGVDPNLQKDVEALIPEIEIILTSDEKVFCNGVNVTKEIRSIQVTAHVSAVSSYEKVREALVAQQRKMAESQSVIMDGRDIGTTVLPNADLKIFQVASVETRARRRYEENVAKGIAGTYEEVEKDVIRRDKFDSSREISPLKQAEDAVLLDTSDLTILEVVDEVIKLVKERNLGNE